MRERVSTIENIAGRITRSAPDAAPESRQTTAKPARLPQEEGRGHRHGQAVDQRQQQQAQRPRIRKVGEAEAFTAHHRAPPHGARQHCGRDGEAAKQVAEGGIALMCRPKRDEGGGRDGRQETPGQHAALAEGGQRHQSAVIGALGQRGAAPVEEDRTEAVGGEQENQHEEQVQRDRRASLQRKEQGEADREPGGREHGEEALPLGPAVDGPAKGGVLHEVDHAQRQKQGSERPEPDPEFDRCRAGCPPPPASGHRG